MGKNSTESNDRRDFSNSTFRGVKIFKMSFFVKFKTSSGLTPYYSISIQEICSTSHLKLLLRPRDLPGVIRDPFGITHFFMKISQKIDVIIDVMSRTCTRPEQ